MSVWLPLLSEQLSSVSRSVESHMKMVISTLSSWILRSVFMPQAPSSMIIGMITRAPIRRKEEREGVLMPEVY